MIRYLVMSIGCLHCGWNSSIVGIYHTEQEANEVVDNYRDPKTGFTKEQLGSQFSIEVFQINIPE